MHHLSFTPALVSVSQCYLFDAWAGLMGTIDSFGSSSKLMILIVLRSEKNSAFSELYLNFKQEDTARRTKAMKWDLCLTHGGFYMGIYQILSTKAFSAMFHGMLQQSFKFIIQSGTITKIIIKRLAKPSKEEALNNGLTQEKQMLWGPVTSYTI